MAQKKSQRLQRQVDQWNALCPVGTRVLYHRTKGDPEPTLRVTRSGAWVMGGRIAVVQLEGVSGCVGLDWCVPAQTHGGDDV